MVRRIKNKIGMSPVIGTGLLLVVAIVAVVSFQGWYGTYFSDLETKIEVQSKTASTGALQIETIVGDQLYIINPQTENMTINSIKVGGNICNLLDNNLKSGMNTLDVSSCINTISDGSASDIVVSTNNGILSKKIIVNSGY
ncbi:MAG: hypothetical protein ACOC16_03135 [Nanoarchaeota archaeon]